MKEIDELTSPLINPLIEDDINTIKAKKYNEEKFINNSEDKNKLDIINNDEENISSSEKFSGTIKVLYHIKDYLFTLLLLIMPCPNFSYLSIPYYFFGIISIFYLLKTNIESRNRKYILEIIIFFYSIFSLIFKGVCLIYDNLFNDELIIQIGIAIKKNKDDIFYVFTTFVPDSAIFIISILSIIITKISKNYTIIIDSMMNKKKFSNIFSIFLWLNFIFISALSCFNISFLTYIYIILINIPILLWCFNFENSKNKQLFYFISIFSLIIMISSNLALVYFNIHKYYPEKNKDLLSLIQKLGIENLNLEFKVENMLLWTGYILSNICIVLLITTQKLINTKIEKEKIKKIIIDENKSNNSKSIEESTIKKIIQYIKNYLSSPSFVLHFTRFGIIAWIYFYRNYPSFFLLIWLCITFINVKTSKNLLITKYIAFPSLYYTITLMHYTNIPNVYIVPSNLNEKIKKEHFGFIKFEYDQRIEYSCLFLVLLLTYLFTYSLVRHIEEKKIIKRYENKNINNNMKDILIENKNENNSISMKNILLKFILANIDKLTLVSMYFVANQFVNFSHVLLVILFNFQLLAPKKFEKTCLFILILVELVFISEYILDLLKVFFDFRKELIRLFLAYSHNIEKTSIEILLFLAIYCLYIQYQFINSKAYQNLSKQEEKENEKLNYHIVNNNQEENQKSDSIFKKIFYILRDIILELYIWIIIVLCFILLCAFEINLLFLVKLLIYLFILYDFLTSIQEKKNLNKLANWIFLLYCAINTLIVYFYQFSQLEICKDFFENIYKTLLPNFIYKNFISIGLVYYTDNLPLKFLPHFGLNFLSILFLRETNRIAISNEQNNNLKKKNKVIENFKLIDEEEDKKQLIKNEEEQNMKIEKEQRNIEIVKKEILQNQIKYYILQTIIFTTKFYFLFLFLTVCLILTNYDISFAITIYISIFGISFLCLFRKNIKNLNSFISKKSFFLSKLIRYSQIELPSHIQSNKYYRSLILKILLLFSELYILLLYSYGTFYMIQHNCDCEGNNCDKNKRELIPKETEEFISSISYLIGFYINISNSSILNTIKFHLFLSVLISFDVYIQRLQNYSIDKSLEIKKIIKNLKRENREIYHEMKLKNKNILSQINTEIKNQKDKLDDEYDEEESFFSDQKSINSSIALRDKKEMNDKEKGFEIIKEKFKKIFSRAAQSKLKLKSTNNSYIIIKGLKNIFEELIILLLLCTSLSKSNIFSYIYMIISIIFVFKKKTMYQYFILMNFLVCSIIIQSIFFVTNMTEKTDPQYDEEMISLIEKVLYCPWFKKIFEYFKLENYYFWGFFFGIGVDKNQINSIWFEFIVVVFIYMYLDLFSFSIYQNVINIGQRSDGIDKINYYYLSKKKKIVDCIKGMDNNDFSEYQNCMEKTFDIKIGKDFESFKKRFFISENDNKEDEDFEFNNKNNDIIDNNKNNILDNKSNNNIIKEEEKKEEIKKEEKKENEFKEMPENDNEEINTFLKIDNEIKENKSPLKNIFKNTKSKIKDEENNINYFKKIRTFIYLSFHNFTIVIIILISMMVNGLISATYFIFSLFFLMQSSNLILGTFFSYPKQIRKNIRIIILIDIFLQLFLQNPIFIKLRDITIINQIEKIIGISEILKYETNKISLNKNQLLLIVSKIITLFLINLQVLMFSSQDFQEFYLTYLITKNDRIKRTQMMNVFIFNNKRVKKMNENIERRITMDKAMNSIEKTLEDWNQKLIHINEEKPINLLDIKKNDQSDNISVMTGGSNLLEENIVREEIKNYILSGFLVRILLFLHKYSSSYNIIEKDRKIYYERDMIQGKTFTKLYLEELIDKELNCIDMSCYKKKEIKIVKMILNGERKRKDEIENDENIEEEKEVNLDNIISKYNDDDVDFNKKNKENKNKKKIKIDFTLDKFKKIDDLREGEIFQKYLKKTTLIIAILKSLIHYFSINFHYITYLMMIINHMISGSFLTLIYPISVFCYAFPQNLRPKKYFWNFCLSTSIIIIIIKFISQLSIIQLIIPIAIKDNLEYYKIGIITFESTFSKDFFNYIICDALVIICISIQIYILINQGLWKEREQDIENIYEANERILLTKDKVLKNDEDIIKFNSKFIYRKNYNFNLKSSKGLFNDVQNYQNEKLIEEIEEEEIENESKKHSKNEINKNEENKSKKSDNNKSKKNEDNNNKISYFSNNEFFKNLFPLIRNEKPGEDYYVFYTSIFMIILLYIIVFYTSMEQDKTFGAVTANQNQFSGIMVIFLVIHVLFLIWDRIIYIRQNRNNLKYKYAIYNKENCKPISQNEYDKIKKDIINKYIEQTELQNNFKIPLNYIETLNNKYKIVFIQHEEFNYPLFGKYIHHILITIFSHILIFFFLPFKGNYNIVGTYYCSKKNDQNENCNNFLDNKYIIFFYILYIFYLSFSSLQIQKGLLDMKKKSILKSGDTSINSGIYNGYKNTPFLYEIKLAIDWTFTTTSLDFFQWAKFESVYDTIYLTMCNMKNFKTKPVGLKINTLQKITLGATIWISLILLLILPLLIFSNLNPINEINNVNGGKTSLKISFIKDNIYSNYTLFENSHVEGIEGMFDEKDKEKPQWNIFNYSLSYMKNFPHNQIQIIYMSDTSDHVWDIAIPHIEKIKQNLYYLNISNSDKIELYYEYSFQRPKPAESKDSIKHIDYTIYDKNKNETNLNVINKLYNAINECKDTEIDLKNFYYAPMRLSSSTHPKLIDLGKNSKLINVKLSFHNCKIVKNENLTLKSYTESYFQIKKNESYNNNHIGIEFHTFSDQVSNVTSSYSVLTFYLSFVLIAGSYVRSFLQGQPEKIILTEMPESEQLVNLCEGIKTARFSFDLEKEEHLYYVLIELMRSPDYLKLLTKSSLQQFKDRKENLKVKKEE